MAAETPCNRHLQQEWSLTKKYHPVAFNLNGNPMDKSNSYGQTKFVDCSEKIGKMDDGQYEIRYYQCSGTWQWRRTLKAVSILCYKL